MHLSKGSVVLAAVAMLATAVGCSASPDGQWASKVCDSTRFLQVEGPPSLSFTGAPKLVAAYASTAAVLNTWNPAHGPHSTGPFWQGQPGAHPMAACFFDGSFTNNDRALPRVLVEFDGTKYKFITAGQRRTLPLRQPPTAR
jgi:hypothetical protein